VRDLTKSHAPLFIYLIFISSVTVMVTFKVMVLGLGLGLRLVVGLGLGLIIPTCRANLVLRVTWQCDIFGMTPAHLVKNWKILFEQRLTALQLDHSDYRKKC